MKAPKPLGVGDVVRYTSKFLRRTGQYTGPAGQARFTIIAMVGPFAVVDAPTAELGMFTEAELAENAFLRFLHINPANLERVRQ